MSVPSWLLLVAPDSSVGCKDVAPMFGMTVQQLYRAIETGRFPAPDFKARQIGMKKNNKIFCWKISTVIELAKARGEEPPP